MTAERLAACIEDPRDPDRVVHEFAEMIRYRALLIAAGYPDGNDCDALRSDPAFKMAVGRLPESGDDPCSQRTISRLENLPGPIALKRMMAAMVDLFCDSFDQVPRRILLDIDDTEDRVHGGQQLSMWNAHYDSRCFLPIHIYEATTGKPVAVILRPGKTPDGAEVALVLRHAIGRIRDRWPAVEIIVRGDSHYGRPEAMAWCERNRVGYIFGLAGNPVLLRQVSAAAEDAALGRLGGEGEKVRRYADFRYAAKSWNIERRVIARVEAGPQGADSRFIVTNLGRLLTAAAGIDWRASRPLKGCRGPYALKGPFWSHWFIPVKGTLSRPRYRWDIGRVSSQRARGEHLKPNAASRAGSSWACPLAAFGTRLPKCTLGLTRTAVPMAGRRPGRAARRRQRCGRDLLSRCDGGRSIRGAVVRRLNRRDERRRISRA